ncbi:MAG: type I restriction-modification enzyme R subunit C-terminal domain-containing protein [Bacteroidia bacterium]
MALVRHAAGIDGQLLPYEQTVSENFRQWVFRKNAGQHNRYTEEQMAWLRLIRDHVTTSFHFDRDDLNFTPFDAQGGVGRMYQLFGEETEGVIEELNEALAA